LLIPLLCALPSCQDSASRENERLRLEITRVHDQAMAEMEPLYLLGVALKELPEPGGDEQAANRQQCLAELQVADEAMFAWMRQYKPLAVASDMAADTQYRVEQLAAIQEVQEQITRALDGGRGCLADGGK
jgi:hypothetical protein